MWVKLDSNDIIIAEYARPVPLRFQNVLYPASIFRNAAKLLQMGIMPVRRVQLNAPEDTTGWESSSEDVIEVDYVRREVFWTKRADFDRKVAERNAKVARGVWDAKRTLLADFLYSKGYISEGQMTPADVAVFLALVT